MHASLNILHITLQMPTQFCASTCMKIRRAAPGSAVAGRASKMQREASGVGGNSSADRDTTSYSWSDERSTDDADVVEVENSVELHSTQRRLYSHRYKDRRCALSTKHTTCNLPGGQL